MTTTGFLTNQPLVEVIYFPSNGAPVQRKWVPTIAINASTASAVHSLLRHVPDAKHVSAVLAFRHLIFVELPIYTSTFPPTHTKWFMCKGLKGHGDMLNPNWRRNPELNMYGDVFLFKWEAGNWDQWGRAVYAGIPIGFIGSPNARKLYKAGAEKLHAGELALRLSRELAT
ncbi:hypothetical protein N7G274_003922 [Stereocaulon virgatum]|uniref:Uncharacterized protein n=1 Tax=Stereocaulon virgatum TaxID=373712 RepID=A0ABR4ADN8_9LECA